MAVSKGIISAFSALVIALIGLFTVNVGSASAAMTFHSGFESGSTFEWSSSWGTFSIQTSIKKTGTYAMRCNPSTSPVYVNAGATANRGTFYLYIAAAPSIETIICGRTSTSSIQLTATNYITLYDGSAIRGTSTTQLALSTWYRISFSRDSSNNGAAYINGTQEISTTTLVNGFSERLGVVSTGAATADLYFDDVAFDNTQSIDDVGDIRTLLSLPNAAGNYTQFDTTFPASPTTHYTKVDDPPLSSFDADYNQHAANSGNAYDTYNIQDALTIGIGANDTVNAVRYCGRMRRGYGGRTTHNLAVRDNGSDYTTPVSATTSFAWYSRYDATMPTGGGQAWTQARLNSFEVGVYHGSGAQDTYISACMVMVAYTPEANISILPPPPNNSYDFGLVDESSITDTALTYFTVTNNSADAVNISISGTDMSGGVTWALSDTATQGDDTYGLKAGLEGGDYTIIVKKTSPNFLVTGLATSASQRWGLQLLAPTYFSDGETKSATVTLTATYA